MLKRLLLVALLLAPLAAAADPVSLAYAYAASVVAGYAGLNVLAVAYVAIATYTTVNARRKAKAAAARARSEFNASLQDRSITALTAIPPLRICYGRFIGGGDIIDVLTSDKTTVREWGGFGGTDTATKADAYKTLVIHIASHEIQAINEVYIDGLAVGALDADGWATQSPFAKTVNEGRSVSFTTTTTLDDPVQSVLACYETDPVDDWVHTDVTPTLSNGNRTVTVPAGKTVRFDYKAAVTLSSVRVRKFLGSDTQSAESYLQSVAPNTDSTGHHLRGLACVIITLDLEDPRFQGGSNQITIDRSGKKLYDPRTGLTTYSTNPALCVRDFLTGYYGYECSDADIDDAYTIAAANACDELISLNNDGVITREARYTCNGEVRTEQGPDKPLEELCRCMAGDALYGARWMIIAGTWAPPISLPGGGGLTDDDLEGMLEVVQAGPGVGDLFNGCRGVFVPSGSATSTDAEPYQNSTFVTADGRELWEDLPLPYTDNAARAKNLFRIFTERSRYAQVIRFPAKLRAWPVRVGDRIPVTNTEYNFVNRIYRVTDWQFGLTSPVVLTLEYDAPEAWDTYDASVANVTANANLPDPWTVSAITGLTASSSSATMVKSGTSGSLVSRVVLEWDEVTDPLVNTSPGYIEILWRRADRGFERMTWPGDQTQAEILGLNHGDRLIIKVRAVNGVGGIGPWTYVAHTVDGPTTVGTVEIEPEAATETFTATGSDGTHTSSAPTDTGSTIRTIINSIVWANTTGETMTVQIESSVHGYKGGTAVGYAMFTAEWLTYPNGGGATTGSKTEDTAQLPTTETDVAVVQQLTVPVGQTVQSYLYSARHVTSGSSGQTITCTFRSPTTRVTVIKR